MAASYQLTDDGIEQQIAINHFGHWVFTTALLDRVRETAKTYGQARIVSLSSEGHRMTGLWRQMDFKDLESMNRTFGSPWIRYGQSKVNISRLMSIYPVLISEQ